MCMPSQRKLVGDEKQLAEHYIALSCNLRLLQNYLINYTGKPVRLKDIINIRTKMKGSQWDLNSLLDTLFEDEGW